MPTSTSFRQSEVLMNNRAGVMVLYKYYLTVLVRQAQKNTEKACEGHPSPITSTYALDPHNSDSIVWNRLIELEPELIVIVSLNIVLLKHE